MFCLTVLIFVGVTSGLVGGNCDTSKCDPDGIITLEKIQNASAAILTDPISTMANYLNLACPGPCTDMTRALIIEQRVFNLSLVDLQILLMGGKMAFDAFYLAFAEGNPSPYLEIAATVFRDGLLIAVTQTNALICQANETINYALQAAIDHLKTTTLDSSANMDALSKCAQKHQLHFGDSYPSQMRNCMRKVLGQLSVEFSTLTNAMAKLKDLFMVTAYNKANCLVRRQSNAELRVALDTSQCVGYWEDLRLDQLYQILNECSLGVSNLSGKITTTATNFQKCAVHYVEQYYEDLMDANIVC